MRRLNRHGAAAVAVCAAAALLVLSIVSPALGGPEALSAVKALKVAKQALTKANKADKRSRQALSQARKVGAQSVQPGPAGIPGAAGTPGAAGPPGDDAFGALSYVEGAGGTTAVEDGYAFDVAVCPQGQAPTGGSLAAPIGGEQGTAGSSDEYDLFGDSGDIGADLDDDGFVESWAAWLYNLTGGASVVATAVCAPAASTPVLPARARQDPRQARLRALLEAR